MIKVDSLALRYYILPYKRPTCKGFFKERDYMEHCDNQDEFFDSLWGYTDSHASHKADKDEEKVSEDVLKETEERLKKEEIDKKEKEDSIKKEEKLKYEINLMKSVVKGGGIRISMYDYSLLYPKEYKRELEKIEETTSHGQGD